MVGENPPAIDPDPGHSSDLQPVRVGVRLRIRLRLRLRLRLLGRFGLRLGLCANVETNGVAHGRAHGIAHIRPNHGRWSDQLDEAHIQELCGRCDGHCICKSN